MILLSASTWRMEDLNVVVWRAMWEMEDGALVCMDYHHFHLMPCWSLYDGTDIDECARGTDNCDSNADCINTQGSFQCDCRDGYEGNGRICTGIM